MRKYFILCLMILSTFLFSKEQFNYGEIKISRLHSIYDGNTFKVDIDDYPPLIGKSITIRIANVDTPDFHTKDQELKMKAYEAKMFTKNFLENGNTIILKNIKRDKYFRIIADVIVDGKNLGSELLKNKLALPYDGNKKPKWIIVN